MIEMAKKVKTEKKVVNKQQEKAKQLYSLEELANLFGVSIPRMRSLYAIRGLDKNNRFSYEEAYIQFKDIKLE